MGDPGGPAGTGGFGALGSLGVPAGLPCTRGGLGCGATGLGAGQGGARAGVLWGLTCPGCLGGTDEHRGGRGRGRRGSRGRRARRGAALGPVGCPGSGTALGAPAVSGQGCGVCRGRRRDGTGCGGGRGAARGLTAPPGSWVELRYGPGCPEPAPSPFSCHADVERMLLEAQLETESGDGTLLVLDAPAWDDSGAGQASEQSEESEVLPAHSQPPPGCPHPRQWDMLEETKRRQRLLPASLGWACTRCPRYLSPKEFAFVCSPQPVLWSLQGGAVGRKKRLFSSELLLLFIPSLLLSHLLTLGLGIYIGKHLAATSANPL
ncbi:BCL2/adenovirus E1B 19 kDa protein-interacting protein 3-like isoform X2 [Neopelma chrysocephalum]|uniref:BCL2/adenovirus E1B 19 kDa protein-interacting protein 3-like isoform X2 n=1 Tax=Neopelma chrysocephalum TaxID=114329 RepID=UPI000FCD0621|nr:BCL2/adenovirus E1B 19 kDa protein-interacting protein 3-like isoform X2 [Neopelma chrysocephalum]